MSTFTAPFAVRAGEGTRINTPVPGSHVDIKTDSRNTNGALTVMEFQQAPRTGPPLHIHTREDEVWWVLEGSFRFKAGDAMFGLSEGDMAFGPRGTPHCYQNLGDAPGRLLVITAPAGVEQFFADFAERPPGPADLEVLNAVALASGVEFVGPPLAVSDPL
jgi:mannose-6-phosphate isomerase-like protein (cupin superfamily)